MPPFLSLPLSVTQLTTSLSFSLSLLPSLLSISFPCPFSISDLFCSSVAHLFFSLSCPPFPPSFTSPFLLRHATIFTSSLPSFLPFHHFSPSPSRSLLSFLSFPLRHSTNYFPLLPSVLTRPPSLLLSFPLFAFLFLSLLSSPSSSPPFRPFFPSLTFPFLPPLSAFPFYPFLILPLLPSSPSLPHSALLPLSLSGPPRRCA